MSEPLRPGGPSGALSRLQDGAKSSRPGSTPDDPPGRIRHPRDDSDSLLAEAGRVVARARRRLLATVLAEGAVRGILVGSLLGALTAVSLRVTGTGLTWHVALVFPVAGGLAGVLRGAFRSPSTETAALALDRAAGTEEAFLCALTAQDARPEFLELSAGYALDRCSLSAVAAKLPVPVPAAATLAAVATALLAATVLVPGVSATERAPEPLKTTGGTRVASSSGSLGALSPAARVKALRESVRASGEVEAQGLAQVVRSDLASIPDGDLESLARTLAESGSEAAERALAALAAGNTAAAVAALREALGGDLGTVRGAGGGGGESPSAPPAQTLTPGAWASPSWPLRYDRTVRRWTQASREADGSGTGGDR